MITSRCRLVTGSVSLLQMTSAYSTGRAFMPLPGSLIDVLEYKVSPLVAAVSHTSEKVRLRGFQAGLRPPPPPPGGRATTWMLRTRQKVV